MVDLVILGAGPSGCAAAITALEAGLSVQLLELCAAPRRQPGETIHPGAEPIFRKLGVWEAVAAEGFHRHRGIWREAPGQERTFAPYGSDGDGAWLGWQVDRRRLHEILRERTTALGGEIVLISRLAGVIASHGEVAGARAGNYSFAAGHVMDATGRRAWLAQELRHSAEKLAPPQRLRFGWKPSSPPELEGQPLFRSCDGGWQWLSPLGHEGCAWAELRQSAKASGIDYTRRFFRECAGPGYCLLGDAACLLDPAAANGVLRAFLSGIYASHLLVSTRAGQITPSLAAAEYRRWMAEMFAVHTLPASDSRTHSQPSFRAGAVPT